MDGMVGMASSVLNDVIMRTGTARDIIMSENDVTMTIAGLWRYGDWRHVATGCTSLVIIIIITRMIFIVL